MSSYGKLGISMVTPRSMAIKHSNVDPHIEKKVPIKALNITNRTLMIREEHLAGVLNNGKRKSFTKRGDLKKLSHRSRHSLIIEDSNRTEQSFSHILHGNGLVMSKSILDVEAIIPIKTPTRGSSR